MILWHCRKCWKKFVGTIMSERCDCGNSDFGCNVNSIVLKKECDVGLNAGVLFIWDEA